MNGKKKSKPQNALTQGPSPTSQLMGQPAGLLSSCQMSVYYFCWKTFPFIRPVFTEHLLHVSNYAQSKTPLLPLSGAKRQWVILTECDMHDRCNHMCLGFQLTESEKEGKASFTEVSPSQGFACYWEYWGPRGHGHSRLREKYCSGWENWARIVLVTVVRKKIPKQPNLNY